MIKSLIKITTYMSLSTIVNMSGQTSVSRHMPIHADDCRRRLPLIFRSVWTSFVSLFVYFPSLFLTCSHLIARQNRNENCFYVDPKNTLTGTKIWKNFGDYFVNFLFYVNFIFKSTLICCLCYDTELIICNSRRDLIYVGRTPTVANLPDLMCNPVHDFSRMK